MPQWDLINEKIIQQRKNKHGNANIMLYTYKVTPLLLAACYFQSPSNIATNVLKLSRAI